MTNPLDRVTVTTSTRGVGREAILTMIDEMNASRARCGIRQRYEPVEFKGELSMRFTLLESGVSSTAPSPIYTGPRLAHAQ